MKTIFIYTLVLSFFCSVSIKAQDIFYKTYTGPDFFDYLANISSRICPLPEDDGYLVYTTSVIGPIEAREVNLMNFDACDNLRWKKSFEITNCYGLTTTSNEIILFGRTEYGNALNFSSNLILRLSYDGNVNSVHYLKDRDLKNNLSYLFAFSTYTDGSFFVSGRHVKYKSDSTFIAKYDVNSKLLWSKSFLPERSYGGDHVAIATSDGGILVYQKSSWDGIIYKIDTDGKLLWAKRSFSFRGWRTLPIEVNDGYVFAAQYRRPPDDNENYLYKVDFNGNLKWTSDVFENGNANLQFTQLKKNGDFVVLGTQKKELVMKNDIYNIVTQIDKNGNLLRQSKLIITASSWSFGLDINSIFGSYLLISGYEGDSITPIRHFIRKVSSLDDLENCGYSPLLNPKKSMSLTLYPAVIYSNKFDINIVNAGIGTGQLNLQENIICFEENPFSYKAEIINEDTTLCKGISLELKSKYPLPFYQWSTGETTPTIVVTKPGQYVLRLGFDCYKTSDTVNVDYWPEQHFEYNIVPDSVETFENVKFTSFSENVDSLSWAIQWKYYSSDSTFIRSFEKGGRYPVVYARVDIYGCEKSDTSFVFVRTKIEAPIPIDPVNINYFIPNSFTPNGDGINENFGPIGEGIQSFTLEVLNRWGELIFNRENQYWNGQEVPIGMYLYIIKVSDKLGNDKIYKGRFTLLR